MGRRFALALLVAGCTSPQPPVETATPASEPRPDTLAVATPDPPPEEPCPHVEGDDAKLFAYDAFGPAAMSYDLLGQAWWQWDGEGHAFEDAEGDVVFPQIPGSFNKVFEQHFVSNIDYRYQIWQRQ